MRAAAIWISITALMALFGGSMLVLGIIIGMSGSPQAWLAMGFWAGASFVLTYLVRQWRR